MVERVSAGWLTREAARSAGVSAQTCRKWVARYRAEGAGGLQDRPSGAAHRRTPPLRRGAPCAACASPAPNTFAEILAMPSLTRRPCPSAAAWAAWAGSACSRPVAMRASARPAGAHRRQAAGQALPAGPETTASPAAGTDSAAAPIVVPACDARSPAGSACTWPSTMPVARPTPRSSRTGAASAVGFLHRALAFYPRHAHPGGGRHDRQRADPRLGGSRADLPEPCFPISPAAKGRVCLAG